MSDTTTRAQSRVSAVAPDWATELLPVACRAVAATLLLPSAVLKIVDYTGRAATFADIGVPAPGVTVLVVALLELAAGALLVTGFEGRTGALTGAGIMVVAIGFVGPVPSNIGVLVSTLGVVVLGTGRYTLGDAERDSLTRMGARLR